MFSKREKISWCLCTFVLSVVIFFSISLITGKGIFGDYTVLKWDGIAQFINFLGYFSDVVQGNTKDIFYSFSITPGSDTSLLWAYYLISPFNLVTLLFEKSNLPLAFFWIECLKIATASLSMEIFIINHIERKKVKILKSYLPLMLVVPLSYSYCGFVAAYTHDIMWLDSVIVLPLLADGLFKLALYKKNVQYFICLTYAIITNFYLGFALCIFSLLFGIYIVIGYKIKEKKVYSDFIATSILAVGSSSVILIPAVEQVFSSKLAESSDVWFRTDRFLVEMVLIILIILVLNTFFKIIRMISNANSIKGWTKYISFAALATMLVFLLHFILGRQAWKGNYLEKTVLFPFRFLVGTFDFYESGSADLMCVYIGVLLFLILLLYLFDYRCSREKKLLSIDSLLICYFMMGFSDVNCVWHGFTKPSGNFYRWSFIFSFFAIFLVIEYILESLTFEEKISFNLVIHSHDNFIIALFLFEVIVIATNVYLRLGYSFLSTSVILFNGLLFVIYFAFMFVSNKTSIITGVISVVLMVEIIINSTLSTVGFEYASKERYSQYISASETIMEDMKGQEDLDEYRVECEYEQNWYYIMGYNTIYHFSSAYPRSNFKFMNQFGMAVDYDKSGGTISQNNFDLSPELTGFLGVRYLITKKKLLDSAYIEIGKYVIGDEIYYQYKNKYALPLVFRVKDDTEKDLNNPNDLEYLERFVRTYDNSGQTGLYEVGDSSYACDITTHDEKIVFSIPFDNGWKAYVDNEAVDFVKAYGYFCALKLEDGEHHIVIKYRNPYITISLILSMISIFLLYLKNKLRIH